MASKQAIRPIQELLCRRPIPSLISKTARRSLATTQRNYPPSVRCSRAQIKPAISPSLLQQSSRRSYADLASPKPKKKRFSILRWAWRLTYLSAIGGVVYLGYGIYLLRTPQEQLEPDPTKKNLIILGMEYHAQFSYRQLTLSRNRVGSCVSP